MNKMALIAQPEQFLEIILQWLNSRMFYVPTFYDNTKENVITKRTVN